MLAQFADASSRGRIFGFHRAMDHTGAIVGPLIATAFLLLPARAVPTALCADRDPRRARRGDAVSGRTKPDAPVEPPSKPPRSAEADDSGRGLDAAPTARHACGPSWASILLFSLGNSADAFLLLRLTDALGGVDVHAAALGAAARRQGVAVDVGRRALRSPRPQTRDRHRLGRLRGRLSRLCDGDAAPSFIAWFLLYGVYFALAEGAEKALVADLTPRGGREPRSALQRRARRRRA